jgi:hypothetical protein
MIKGYDNLQSFSESLNDQLPSLVVRLNDGILEDDI